MSITGEWVVEKERTHSEIFWGKRTLDTLTEKDEPHKVKPSATRRRKVC